MSAASVCYFGYGSLVNRDTRPHDEPAFPARLSGWQRVWSHRVVDPNRDFGCTSLNVEPAPGSAIDGVLVRMPATELATLDARERGYRRVALRAEDLQLDRRSADMIGDYESVFLYVSLPEHTAPATAESPILQSYVDCVMAGFERLFGDAGLADFIDSTRGWSWPRIDDRDNPYYPRAVPLTSDRHRHYDDRLRCAAKKSA